MVEAGKDRTILFLFLIFLVIISMSIGYCTVNDIVLNINGNIETEAEKMLYIDSIEIDNDTSTGGEYKDYKSEKTLLQITSLELPKENVTEDTNVTILVHLVNTSDISYGFKGIKYLTAEDLADFPSFSVVNSNSNIKIDENSYKDLIDTIIFGSNFSGSGEITIPITFKYVDINNITDNTLDISLLINFEELEIQTYQLKTGKNLYSEISSYYSDAKKIIFCSDTEVPKGATEIGDAGINEGEIKVYWSDETVYIATKTKNAIISFNEDSGYMFSNGKSDTAFLNVTAIEATNGITIDTSNVKQFEEMFKGCSSLTSSGVQPFLNKFDTRNATNMCAMFGGTTSLTTLDLSGFDTSKVTDMSWMFENDTSLTGIKFGGKFSTESVKGIRENQGLAAMFVGCSGLVTLDLTCFDTSNVGSMWFLFSGCTNLRKIYVSDKFVTTGLLSTTVPNSTVGLFKNCTKLEGESGTTYETSKVNDAYYAHIDGGTNNPGYFSNLKQYTVTLDANGGKFENGETVKTYTGVNNVTVKLDEIPTKDGYYSAGWGLTKDTTMTKYFYDDEETFFNDITLYTVWHDREIYTLKTGPNIFDVISGYKDKAEHILFTSVEKLPADSILIGNVDVKDDGDVKTYFNENNKTLYFATKAKEALIGFNRDSSHMFSNGKTVNDAFYKVQTIDIDSDIEIDTSHVEDFSEIFKYNIALTESSLQAFINRFNTVSLKNMCAMFEYLSFENIDVSKFDTKNVTDMSWIFHGSSYINIVFGDNFNTSSVTNYEGMFQGLKNIEVIDISMFRVKNGANIQYMFGKDSKLKTIYVSENSGFENASQTRVRIFENCQSLVGGNGTKYSEQTSVEKDASYARIDTADTPGYFTNINDKKAD